ncbi:unnamed protein product [Diamesa serratosioi]
MYCTKMSVEFTINGKSFKATPPSVPITTTLNTFIRNHAHLTGTKFMCLEGGCGVCVVTLKGTHPVTKKVTTWAVNSCLQNIYSCHGLDIITVEGIGSKKTGLHQVQSRLANFNGTQCGYCSPGMVMNMYSLLESKDGKVSMEEVENSFGGNICRCTGYRPILDAFKSLATDADQSLLDLCKDIEDLSEIKNCPKTGSPCAGTCSASEKLTSKNPVKLIFEDEQEWHKVYSIKELYDLFGKIADKPYMLVAGNTAHGVYRRSTDLKVFIDISSVEELRGYETSATSLDLGGNVTLTEAMEIFTKVAAEKQGFEYLRELVKHIDLIANVPVRNNGTIAGNLMIKNAHSDFPSDMFLMLETAGATMTISNGTSSWVKMNSPVTISPKEFLNTNMNKKVITKISLPALDASKFVFKTYKIMPRAQNAHAYVNAGFLIEFNDTKTEVKSARVCFGGISPESDHIIKMEEYLVGKDLFDDSTIRSALKILKEEIKPDWVLPDASPEYRRNLAFSLFYKFVLNIVPSGKCIDHFKSGGNILSRGLSSGTQVFDTYKKNWPLTKNIPKIEADVQCSGEAKYVNDFPSMPGEVYGAFVLARNVHVKISSIDASLALKIPGVVAFYSAKDIPGINNFMPEGMLFVLEPEQIFCDSIVKFYGQPVGILLAESNELANLAADLVEIHYEKSIFKTFAPTLKEVLKKDPARIETLLEYCKTATKVGVDGAHQIKGRFEIEGQYHFTLEPQTCICVPIEDGMDVYSATQWMDTTQIAIADSLKVPNNTINMQVRRLGGGFGGKISRPGQIACATALAAHLLNRTVRVILTIEANMTVVGKRYSCINNYDVEVDDNGKVIKLTNDYVEDYGCSTNEPVHFFTTEFFSNCYNSDSYNIIAKRALTDSSSNTWCRGPGTMEGIAMIENIMEHISRKVNKDPTEVRLMNMKDDCKMKTILPNFINSIDYIERKKSIDDFNSSNRWIKRGIAIVPMKYHLGYFGTSHSIVSIFHGDGSVAVSVGSVEMGQGLNTKVTQTVAHMLGIPLKMISVKTTNTLTAPNAIVTGGGIGSEISCFAIQKACEILLQRLKPIKDEFPVAEWSELIKIAFAKNIDLCANYMYKPSDLKDYDIWGISCCEVEVDVLTGNIQLKRVDIWEDVGESMSPGIDVGQIEGAFVMGLGYWLTEKLIYNNQNGELLTNRTWNYKPPGAKDIPIDFRITFFQNSSNQFGVLRSKSTGEPALCMSIVSIFALRHALDSARKDSGITNDVYYHLGAPSTAETIFSAANNSIDQFLLK